MRLGLCAFRRTTGTFAAFFQSNNKPQPQPQMKTHYKQEPAEEPPMADWPEPSPDDIEPSPEPDRSDRRMRVHLSYMDYATIEEALREVIRRRIRNVRQWKDDDFLRKMFKRNLKRDISALRSLREYKFVRGAE